MILSFEMLEGPSPLQVPIQPNATRSREYLRRLVEELFAALEVRTIALMRGGRVVAVYDGTWNDVPSDSPFRRIAHEGT